MSQQSLKKLIESQGKSGVIIRVKNEKDIIRKACARCQSYGIGWMWGFVIETHGKLMQASLMLKYRSTLGVEVVKTKVKYVQDHRGYTFVQIGDKVYYLNNILFLRLYNTEKDKPSLVQMYERYNWPELTLQEVYAIGSSEKKDSIQNFLSV